MRGWGTVSSGSSLRSSPTSSTSTSSVRGPQRTSRTRPRAFSARRARSSSSLAVASVVEFDHQVPEGVLGHAARPVRSRRPTRGGIRRSPTTTATPAARCSAPVAEVRAQREVGPTHYGRCTVQRTPTDATSSTTGGRTLRTDDRDRDDLLVEREHLVGDAVGQRLEQAGSDPRSPCDTVQASAPRRSSWSRRCRR